MHKSTAPLDRFISGNTDQVASNYGTKTELFDGDRRSSSSDSPFNVNNSNNSQENL